MSLKAHVLVSGELKIFFPETKGLRTFKHGMQHRGIILFFGPRSNYLFGPLTRLFSVFFWSCFFFSVRCIFCLVIFSWHINTTNAELFFMASSWNPHHKDQTRKLEMVQRRAARYTTNRFRNTSSVSSMLEHLQWESLESRRVKIQLTLFYKVVNNLVDIPAADYLVPSTSSTRASHSKRYRRFSTSSDSFKFSFFSRTVPSWNSLPATVAEAPSLVSFKEGLSTLLF